MSYKYANTLFDTRQDAITCLVEEFLWAGGWNDADDVIAALRDRGSTIDELMESWDLNIGTSDEHRDEVTREEIEDAFAAIIAVKSADPEELDADRLIYDESELESIAAEDPSLIVRITGTTYEIHEARPGHPDPIRTRAVDDIDQAKEVTKAWAEATARERETKAFWCDGTAFHDEPGLRPVEGYDIGEPGAENPVIVLYELTR